MALPHYNFYDMTLVEPRFIAANKSKGSIKFKYPRDESRGHLHRAVTINIQNSFIICRRHKWTPLQKIPVASRFIAMKKKEKVQKNFEDSLVAPRFIAAKNSSKKIPF